MKSAGILLSLALLTGCVSESAHWNRRIGKDTFNQVLKRNKQPTFIDVLDNGDTVVIWDNSKTHFAPATSYYNAFNDSWTHYPGGVSHYTDRMILTFDRNDILKDWRHERE